jgi:AcrR family transcriptional regulator
MPYRSTEKTRQKKDAKRTAMMQAAVRVFAEKGYHTATIRDVVNEAEVAIGTFYFYFPDKETLFVHLYEETADFLLQTIAQAINSRATFPQKASAALQGYVSIAVYEPAVVQMLLVGGVGAVPSLEVKRAEFRERLTNIWQRPIDACIEKMEMPQQNGRRTAEALAGAFDEVVLNVLAQPEPELEADGAVHDMVDFALRATGYLAANPQ